MTKITPWIAGIFAVFGLTGFTIFLPASVPQQMQGFTSPPWDVQIYTAITSDVQASLARGDLEAAQQRISDLDVFWQLRRSKLRVSNPDDWAAVDKAIVTATQALNGALLDDVAAYATLDALRSLLATPDLGIGNRS